MQACRFSFTQSFSLQEPNIMRIFLEPRDSLAVSSFIGMSAAFFPFLDPIIEYDDDDDNNKAYLILPKFAFLMLFQEIYLGKLQPRNLLIKSKMSH